MLVEPRDEIYYTVGYIPFSYQVINFIASPTHVEPFTFTTWPFDNTGPLVPAK